MVSQALLGYLVCPVSGGPLSLRKQGQELWCLESGLAYPVEDDIPVLLEQAARTLSEKEKSTLKD